MYGRFVMRHYSRALFRATNIFNSYVFVVEFPVLIGDELFAVDFFREIK